MGPVQGRRECGDVICQLLRRAYIYISELLQDRYIENIEKRESLSPVVRDLGRSGERRWGLLF